MEGSSGFLSKSKHAENEENDDDQSDEIDDAMHGEPRDLPSVSLALAHKTTQAESALFQARLKI
jgi:hypothetical protein